MKIDDGIAADSGSEKKETVLHGIPASSGIEIGIVLVVGNAPEQTHSFYETVPVSISEQDVPFELSRFEEALDFYNHILEKNNENFHAMINKGNLLMSLNKFDDAIDCYEEILIWQDLNSQQKEMFNHILKQKKNSGFFAVSELNSSENNWVYTYMKNDEFKQIFAEDIKKLRRKVYDNNLIWTVLDKNLARESRRKDLTRGNKNE